MMKSDSTLPTLSDENMHSLESDCYSKGSDEGTSCASSIETAEMARFQKIIEETLETDSVDLNGYQSFRRSFSTLDQSHALFDIDQDETYEIPLSEPSVKIVVEFDEKLSLNGLETTKLVDSSRTQRGLLSSSQHTKRSMNSAAA